MALTIGATACQGLPDDEARRLVERYNRVVCEAYRRADVTLIDPVVGPNEGRKLTGLIGVRLDAGITLDAELLELQIVGVDQSSEELRVRTSETWSYRDRRIGSGEQVGEESLDEYEMLYVFKMFADTWKVDEIRFATPPRVGRPTGPFGTDRAERHDLPEQVTAGEEPTN